jgi:preprotein translocase subunit SecA
MFYDVCENSVYGHSKDDFESFELDLLRIIGIESPVSAAEYGIIDRNELVEKVYAAMAEQYKRKSDKIAQRAYPQVKHVYETMSNKYENIVFPLTDGRREVRLVLNLKEAYNSEGRAITRAFEKNILLGMIDNEWKEHLREMDDLRSAVHHAQYEQKDPLLVYKLESFELFKAMLQRLNTESIELLMKLDIPFETEFQSTNSEVTQQHNYDKAQVSSGGSSATSSSAPPRFQGSEGYKQAIQNSLPQQEKQQPMVAEPKIGRNDPCPCGSGKKFKQCHGK